MASTRRQVPSEFKIEAVRLITEGGCSVAQGGRELGSRPNMLRNWNRQAQGRAGFAPTDVFPGTGHQPSQEDELRHLQRENALLRQERDFLKTTAAYVAKESR